MELATGTCHDRKRVLLEIADRIKDVFPDDSEILRTLATTRARPLKPMSKRKWRNAPLPSQELCEAAKSYNLSLRCANKGLHCGVDSEGKEIKVCYVHKRRATVYRHCSVMK